MSDHAIVFAYDDEGGFLSPGAKFDIEKLINEDSVLALDVLNDWFYIIARYHAAAFAAGGRKESAPSGRIEPSVTLAWTLAHPYTQR